MVTARQPTAAAVEQDRPCVLLVEDQPAVSKLVSELLEEAGYAHVSIADHTDIPAAINRWQPRCIILDGDPGSRDHERSWEDAAAIRRAHPAVPVLMFTASTAAMDEAKAGKTARSKAAGYAGVVDKPILVVEFLATLRHAVEGQSTTVTPQGPGGSLEAIAAFPDLGGTAASDLASADFISMAVHELRTPLTAIAGHAQRAQRFITADPLKAADALLRIREQSARLNRLIGDLLDQARVNQGGLSLVIVPFDLGVVAAGVVSLHDHGDASRISFPRPTSARVRGDPDRISQILGNLLDNAVKYSPAEAAIDVTLAIIGNQVQLRVTDHGVGVPEDEQDRLFAPFFRSSRTRRIAGTGLGLHISRRIAEQHQGSLSLESSNTTGSVFLLTLPVAAI